MPFLYWPKPVRLRDDRLGIRKKCWVIQVSNPERRGLYRNVRIWVHQESGAMLRMEGYGWGESKYPIKRFKVTEEGVTPEQKEQLVAGATELLQRVLNKNPQTTIVAIDEVPTDNWGIAGELVTKRRAEGK